MDESFYRNLNTGRIERLSKISDDLESADFTSFYTRSILFSELSKPASLDKKLHEEFSPKAPYNYAIYADINASLEELDKAYPKKGSELRKRRSVSRYRGIALNNHSRCIYVGTSNAGNSRFKQHCGYAAKGTYSLQLCYWANDLNGGLRIDIMEYPGVEKKLILQLEEEMSKQLNPLFGKLGSV